MASTFRLNSRSSLLTAALLGTLSLAPGAARAVEATDVADGYISTASPALSKKSFGLVGSLVVANKQNAYVQFLLDTVPDSISGNSVQKATLKLWVGRVIKPGTLKLSSAGNGAAINERTLTGTNAPALGTALATIPLAAADAQGYVTVDVTAYLKSLTLSQATNVTFALSQNTASDGTYAVLDSKESLTTSHGPVLDISLVPDVSALTGTPASSFVIDDFYNFVSTLAGTSLKAGQSVLVIADVVLSASSATEFDVSIATQPSNDFRAPTAISAQHYSMPAAFGPQSFSRSQIFTAPADGSYTIGVAVKRSSGAGVDVPDTNSDVTIIKLQ